MIDWETYDTKTIDDMVGMTFEKVYQQEDDLVFITSTGECFRFTHRQDCCERVVLAQIDGDLKDLKGVPLRKVRESTNIQDDYCRSWTFYHFATMHGYVTVRWEGSSNGYYSMGVSVLYEKLDNEN